MQSDMYYDAVIAGCGVAGLYTALNLPETMRILMICKGDMAECDSMLAQGGDLCAS
jgi:L-aspartate oxidase